ncbi:helix-turn-helix domain-containing protein [Streptomyces sp. NPDC021093]|uniref:helix-turn-helix domain-containing protein n=1 Tax=Streptomyces sp. NPDC021093 TaxID=3365112 RepID=UPI0037AC8DEA
MTESQGRRPGGFVQEFSTREGQRGTRVDWQELVRDSFGGAQVDPLRGSEISGTITQCRLGEVQVSTVDVDPHLLVRDQVRAADRSCRYVSLCSVVNGEVYVDQDGRQSLAGAGSLIAFDGTREHAFMTDERLRMIVLLLPHDGTGLTPGASRALTVAPWRGDRGVGALLQQMLGGVMGRVGELEGSRGDSVAVGSSISHLASALFAERLGGVPDEQPGGPNLALFLRIQTGARTQLGDPELDSAALARRHHISLRYLQLLFQEQGTSPARWIREERLRGAYRELVDPRFAQHTVGAVGQRWGLPDASQFSRLFRARYGSTPSAVRALRGSASGAALLD